MAPRGYDAFISYSHDDAAIASDLHAGLERYGKRWRQGRRLRVFRDKNNLAVTPGPWETIRGALDESRFLIVIMSPGGATSPWVDKEVAWWLQHRSAETILLVLVEGTLEWDELNGRFRLLDPAVLPASAGKEEGT